MVRGDVPGALEQVVLLALAGLESEATGREVYEVVTRLAGHDVSVAAIHITLQRAHDKGWAECRTVDPPRGAGGKPGRRYSLSSAGAAVLSGRRSVLERLWRHAAVNPLLEAEES